MESPTSVSNGQKSAKPGARTSGVSQVTKDGDIVIVPKGDIAFVEFDLHGEKVNKMNSSTMGQLDAVVQELKGSSYKAVVLISKKEKIFIAGADIDEIKALETKEDFEGVLNRAHEILSQWEDLPMVTIAAIHGACMGGGTEWSLACDYRLCTDDKSTQIGLPEVKLGIIPGFGGCVRLPRLIGLQAALGIILEGKSVDSRKAKKMGLVDAVCKKPDLETFALKFAQDKVATGKRKKYFQARGLVNKTMETLVGRQIVFSQAKKMTLAASKGFYPAPLKALEVIQKTYGMSNRSKALKIEAAGFCEVAVTDISKNLIELFFMMESIKKQTGVADTKVKGREVKFMGVLGAGTMGGGIAYQAADKGIEVRMKDITNKALAIGYKAARDLWEKRLKQGRMNKFEFAEKNGRVSGSLDFNGFKDMDFIVEAIVEDMAVKKKVIADTIAHCKPDVIFATNTSSLSVTEMSSAHPKPENFVGMHFFNPVDKMPLVEVIRGERTSDEAAATVFELSKRMGKTPVVVKDGPGFLVNRLLLPYMIEAMFMVQEGMDIETLDDYFTKKFGMPMGPCRLMDEVGLDVCVKVVKSFKKSLGDRIEVPEIAKKLESSDRLGRKNKKGFYFYDDRGKQLTVDSSIYKELGLNEPTNPLTEKECLERGIFIMVNEASLALLQDHIVDTPEQVDLAMIMGTGFPPFRGGLLRYADKIGTDVIVQELEEYANRFGPRLKPAVPLVNLGKSKKTFF